MLKKLREQMGLEEDTLGYVMQAMILLPLAWFTWVLLEWVVRNVL